MTGVRNKTRALYAYTLPVIRYLAEIVSWPHLGMHAAHVRTCNSLQYTEGSSHNIQKSETLQATKRGKGMIHGFHDPGRSGEQISNIRKTECCLIFLGSCHPADWFWPINLAEKLLNVGVYWHRIQSSSSKTRHFQCCNISAAYSLKPEHVLEYFRDVSLISES